MTPADPSLDLDINLGWDWLSSRGPAFFTRKAAWLAAGPRTRTPFRTSSAVRAAALSGHGEFRRILRGVVPAAPTRATGASAVGGPARLEAAHLDSHWGHAENAGPFGCVGQLRRAQRRSGPSPPPSPPLPRFEDGTALLTDGTELHLASLRFVDTPTA